MRVWPTPLCEVISVTLAILPSYQLERARDAGCDRLGAGAGSCCWTAMAGKSTCGSAETGSLEKDAGQRDPNSQQRGCGGAANEWRRQLHGSTSSPAK
jgi:hypothetical protein